MTRTAVRLDCVGKKYRLFSSRLDRLKEALHPSAKTYHEDFWALRDISLSIPHGETLGILGLNGSGKSTLLQIVAGILRPTLGTCETDGRVAALLELGAGFSPEMTGRENVITNAMIMGLTKAEALARLPEVQDFAGIGRHFDAPVKTYSSGMFMRVAFSTSLFVDPDIMIVDEALAVGDSKFQEKCFRRLKEFQVQGGTTLYVSHDRASVTHLCDRAVLLHGGQLVLDADPKTVVDGYTELLATGRVPSMPSPAVGLQPAEEAKADLTTIDRPADRSVQSVFKAKLSPADLMDQNPLYNADEKRWGLGGAAIVDALLLSGERTNPASVLSGSIIELYVKTRFDKAVMNPLLGIVLTNVQGITLYATHTRWMATQMNDAAAGDIRTYKWSARVPFNAGPCFLEVAVAEDQDTICDARSRVLTFEIQRDAMFLGLVDLAASCEEVGADLVDYH